MKKLLNLIPESLTRASGHQTVFKKLNVFKYPANPFWKRLSEDRNNFSARFEHKYIYKGLKQKKQYEESMILSIILARVKIRVKIRKKYDELRYDCSFRCSHRFFAAHSDAWRRFGTSIFLKML